MRFVRRRGKKKGPFYLRKNVFQKKSPRVKSSFLSDGLNELCERIRRKWLERHNNS